MDDANQRHKAFDVRPLVVQAIASTMAITSFVALAGPIGKLLDLAPWKMGAAVTVAGIAWMLLARPWGLASDRYGRRPVLLAGLAGFACCHGVLCVFVALALDGGWPIMGVFIGLLLWRGMSGAFYTAVPASCAALVADHTPPAGRPAAMATLGMASGASMVVGPALAAALAPFGLALPLYLSAVLPFLALAVMWRGLPHGQRQGMPPAGRTLRLTDGRLRRPMVVAFMGMFSVSVAQIVVGFYAIDRLGLDPQQGAQASGIALACVGAALTVSQMLVRRLDCAPLRLIRLGTAIASLGFASAVFAVALPMLWGAYFVAAFGMGMVWPSISALAANAVAPHEQGVAAGTVSAAQGLGNILGPLAGAAVYSLDQTAPYIMIATTLALLALWRGQNRGQAIQPAAR